MAERRSVITQDAKAAVAALLADVAPVEPVASGALSAELADLPLRSADVGQLAEAVRVRLEADAIVLPDADELVRRAVIGALSGHLVLHGPPGTGKTLLARALANAFECSCDVVTATPEWTTYDVIGGLRPGVGPQGSEVLTPVLGTVTRAALRCAATLRSDPDAHPQAHWLVIDELSRADIDKAMGPLYTALSGRCAEDRGIELWFEEGARRTLVLPERFRILGTMNDVDTAFVNQLSQGLQRRFQFVFVGVPAQEQTAEEVRAAATQAARWLDRLYRPDAPPEELLADARVEPLLDRVVQLVDFLRWDEPRWPLGTAQLVDVLRHVALEWHALDADAPLDAALDAAVADRLLPQASGLDEDVFEPLRAWLEEASLPRAVAALAQIEAPRRT